MTDDPLRGRRVGGRGDDLDGPSGAGPDGGCDLLPGDVFGVTAYVPNPIEPGDGLSKLALQSQLLGGARENGEAVDPPVVDPSPSDVAYALGTFDQILPGPDGVCTVTQLAPAEIHLGAVVDADAPFGKQADEPLQ